MSLVPMTAADAPDVAGLHCRRLTGLLTALGVHAARAFYRGAARTDAAVGFVYADRDGLRGFVLGSSEPRQLWREVLVRNPGETLWGLILGVLRRPSTVLALRQSGGSAADGADRSPELMYLAVDEASTRAGIGAQLVSAFTQAMRDRGIGAYELSVDADNARAIEFYEKRGFRAVGEVQQFGIRRRRYRCELWG